MQHFLQQLPNGLPPQAPAVPVLPPGPSLDRLRGPVEIPPLELWQVSLITLLGALILSLIGWLILRYLRYRKKNVLNLPPHEIAIGQLKIAAQEANGDDKYFAVLSAQAIRHYFAGVNDTNMPGKTTDEFIQSLETDPLVDSATRTLLSNFLHECDQIKFAGVQLTDKNRQSLTEDGLHLVQKYEEAKNNAVDNETPS